MFSPRVGHELKEAGSHIEEQVLNPDVCCSATVTSLSLSFNHSRLALAVFWVTRLNETNVSRHFQGGSAALQPLPCKDEPDNHLLPRGTG